MLDKSLQGGFAQPAVQSAAAFRAALNVLARPGRIAELHGAQAPAPVSPAAAALLLTLCDAETPVFLAPGHDGAEVRDWVAFHIGAPIVAASQAQFALGTWAALTPLSAYPVGDAEYPDRSATLIVELDALSNSGPRLTGPGIQSHARLSLPETAAFRANRQLFPLGLDFYFAAGHRLAGLPRSTLVEDL
ncbi:phosphonate C-P lyase system protein PhnH [Thalassobius sp. S69A]|uniref:phosphonate C-P lyase system protein PhnH n=1 Tax=unclassified Thalassovita TaxID=2619711 RepID=UPI003C7E5131